MIELKRNKENKWIFQKNIQSTTLIESYLAVINTSNEFNKENIRESLRQHHGYRGRSENGSLSTMGVRFSQMCFYMFGYKKNNVFMPTQMTLNLLNENSDKAKNMLINLFSIQYPHPYSKTNNNIRIYAGRLILKLLCEERIEKKLYIDEMIYFLPFLNKVNENIYNELIDSIVEYRTLSYEKKLELFKREDDWESLFANCAHEMSYYFARIFESFGVFEISPDPSHNDGKLFKFKHGTQSTYRSDAYTSRSEYSGFIRLKKSLLDDALNLLSTYSPFDIPTSLSDEFVFSKDDWISDLYEVEPLNYLRIVLPAYNRQRDIIDTVSKMQYMSKYSSVDGKDFEKSLKPVFELFRENLNVEIISGAGDTDLLCVFEELRDNLPDYKVNIEAKSRNSANNMNPIRINRHIETHNSKYCIIVAPRFSTGNDLDIKGLNMVSITADALGQYCSKECLSSHDGKADFDTLNRYIEENKGTNISRFVNKLVEDKYGISITNTNC